MTTSDTPKGMGVDTILNLSHFHREHELFYSKAPLDTSVRLQVASGALKALATTWQEVADRNGEASTEPQVSNPYAGCTDLNDSRATQALGILFMEGEGKPAELTKLEHDLLAMADDHEQGGGWLDKAMEGSWTAGKALIRIPPLAPVLGDRHRIIVNNWQMASNSTLIARLLRRAVDLLESVELTPESIRADLAGPAFTPGLVLSAAEIIDTAADLSAQSGLLVHDSEPRWRRFRQEVDNLNGSNATDFKKSHVEDGE